MAGKGTAGSLAGGESKGKQGEGGRRERSNGWVGHGKARKGQDGRG